AGPAWRWEGSRASGRGDPEGKLRLHRPRERADQDGPLGTLELDLLSAPEPPDDVELVDHPLLAVLEGVGPQGEVVRLPSGRERNADATRREVVDERPLLGHPNGVMERAHAAPGADLHALGDHRERRARDGWIRIEAAERVEVPLGRPHRREAVLIGEAGALEQEAILLARALPLVGREVEEAQVDL